MTPVIYCRNRFFLSKHELNSSQSTWNKIFCRFFLISPEKHLSERSRQKLHFQPKTSSLPGLAGITEYSTLTKSISNREILLLWILNPRTKISDWENVSELLDERTNERTNGAAFASEKSIATWRDALAYYETHTSLCLSVCLFVCLSISDPLFSFSMEILL